MILVYENLNSLTIYEKHWKFFLECTVCEVKCLVEIWCRSEQIQALGKFLNLGGLIRPRRR